MKELSALDLYYLTEEFQILVGGKIDKVFGDKKKELLIQFHIPKLGKKLMKITPTHVYLTQTKQVSERPNNFCMALRKFTSNRWVRKISMHGFERVLEFELEGKEKNKLIIELFHKGNIILCDDAGKIKLIQETQKWKDRTLRGGVQYVYPEKGFNPITDSIKDLEITKESIVKSLAIDAGLGGRYAEELCLMAEVDKDKASLKKTDIEKLDKARKEIFSKSGPGLGDGEFVPFKLSYHEKFEKKESFSDAIDGILTPKIAKEEHDKAVKESGKKKKKAEKIIDIQTKQIKKLETDQKEFKEAGEKIYLNYDKVKSALAKKKRGTSTIDI